jgi:hypothetical protein
MKSTLQVAGASRVSASQSHALNQGIPTEMDQMDPILIAILVATAVKVGIVDVVSP